MANVDPNTLLRKGNIFFAEKAFFQKVLWNWYYQNAQVFNYQHRCYVLLSYISTDSRHSYVYQIVLLFSPTYFFIRIRQTSNTGFSMKRKEANPILWFHVSVNNSKFCEWLCASHLSHWASDKGYHIYHQVSVIRWHTHINWQWGPVKSETLRQNRWF